jgi:hypothetical protein
VAEKRARRVIHLSVPRQQATGAHCELTGVWRSPTGASISLYEGQFIPSDSGRACVWTYADLPASSACVYKGVLRQAQHADSRHQIGHGIRIRPGGPLHPGLKGGGQIGSAQIP